MRGIDISNWKADFPADKADYDFLIVQTTWGAGEVTNNGIVKSVWPGADAKIQAAIRRGKPFGFCHYVRGVGAAREAAFAVEHNRGYIGHGVATVDWEADDNAAWGNMAYLDEFLREFIRLSGVKPLVYTMASALGSVAPVAAKHDCGLWVAQYASDAATGWQDKPWNEGAYSCVIRQYASNGRVPGYGGALDLDKAYITPAQWAKYANPNGKPATAQKPAAPAQPARKSIDVIAAEVIAGKWGNGADRVNRLRAAGYDAAKVQAKVNERMKPPARTYTVRPGDTLSGIAARYGTTYIELARKNGIGNPNLIFPGQVIRID